MKITFFLLFAALIQVSAAGFAQKITFTQKDATLKQVFNEINKQTGYNVFWSPKLIKNSQKRLDVNFIETPLEDALSICLKGRYLTYSIDEKTIIIKETEKYVLNNIINNTIDVEGKVVDQKGQPLPGASIKLKGTSIGAVTDSNGQYRISAPDEKAILVFSFIGFVPQEISINGRTNLNVVLVEEQQALSEMVVVGYGTQKKINLTGAVDVVSGEQLANRSQPNVSMLLQGISPNMNINLNKFGGEPGTSQSWQIRGVGSLSSNTSPLIMVDGVEASIKYLDPETIESISILKDASASAVYGSRAAFGVVLITTKTGGKNQPIRIGYSNNMSFNAPMNVPDMESSLVYATAFNQAAANSGISPTFPDEQVARIKGYLDGSYKTEYNPNKPPNSQWRGRWDGNANNNWTREYYQKYVLQQKHNINISGSDSKTQYYINVGMFDQPGVYSWGDDEYKRNNILANVSSRVADWVSFNFSTKYSKDDTDVPIGMVGYSDRTYLWSQFIDFFPTMPKYNIDGTIANPLILVLEKGGRVVTQQNDLWMNIGTELEPIKGWKTNLSYKYNSQWGTDIQNPKPVPVPIPNGTTGNIGEARSAYRSLLSQGQYNLLSLFSSYEKSLCKNYLKGLIGYEQDLKSNRGLNGSKTNLITEAIPSINTAVGDINLSDYRTHWATQGVFGRVNYNYDEKYLVEFSARYDGSSRFAPGSRWGFFPSFSAGYNISKENFWKGIEPYVNTFKLRSSYGSLGNQNVNNYLYLPTIPIAYRGYNINNVIPLYANVPQIISDKLTWETITTFDVGAEAEFLNRRLNVVFDWYDRVTSNMLGPSIQLPSVLGTSAPSANNAKLSTKGFEISIGWKDKLSSDFSYDARVTLGDNQTTILEYLNVPGSISGWYKGKKYGDIWGLTTDRIIQTAGEAMPDQSYYYNKWGPGDIAFKDLDNNGKINEGSRTLDSHGDLSVIANETPRYSYGIMAGFNWKALDFNMFWQGIGKSEFLPSRFSEYFWGFNDPGSSTILKGGKMLDYWRPANETNLLGPNTDSYFPKPYFTNERNKNKQEQSRYVLNAAYLRLKSLQIGYTVPSNLLKKVFIQQARLYISGENLLTFTKLPKLYEPETMVASDRRQGGVDTGEIYPINQMFSLGVNLKF